MQPHFSLPESEHQRFLIGETMENLTGEKVDNGYGTPLTMMLT